MAAERRGSAGGRGGEAYGGQGAGGVIGPDETLVFIVDLISVG